MSARDRVPAEDVVAALRAELDDVRAALDRAEHELAAPHPAVATTRRRRQRVLVAAALVLALALVAAAGGLLLSRRPADGPDRAGGPASGAVTGDRPGLDALGTDVTVAAQGTALLVEESVVVAGGGPLQLVLPDPSALPGARVVAPQVRDVTARVDGAARPVRPAGKGWAVDTGASPARVDLRYTLAGAVERRAAGSGRALVVVTPLSAASSRAAGDPVLVRMTGARVLQAACIGAPQAEQLCGAGTAGGWVATIPASSPVAVVVLQVDLVG